MKIGKLFVLVMVLLLASSFASAVNLDVKYVRINGEQLNDINSTQVGTHADNLKVKRGDDLNIRVRVQALGNVSNAQIEADIYGYRYSYKDNSVTETTKVFDLDQGDIDTYDLKLQVPTKMDTKYTLLRIRVGDEDGLSFEKMYQLHIEGIDSQNAVQISDYSFSPSTTVNAGRAFTSTVKVENIGDDDLNDVKVTVAIPALNIQDSGYLDQLDANEKETLEEFLLRIPDCAEPGTYTVEMTADFDNGEQTKKTTQMTVLEGDACAKRTYGEAKTVVTAPKSLKTNAGSEVFFPIMVTNTGSNTKVYSLVVTGIDAWGEYRMTPGAQTVVKGKATEEVDLYVTPNEGVSGERLFLVTVTTDGETNTVPLILNIEGSDVSTGDDSSNVSSNGSSTDFRKALEIALVVLVIILIIVGLIIGFNKLRGNDDEDDTQTYY